MQSCLKGIASNCASGAETYRICYKCLVQFLNVLKENIAFPVIQQQRIGQIFQKTYLDIASIHVEQGRMGKEKAVPPDRLQRLSH